MGHPYSLVIRNGTVLDGSGGRPYLADVAIRDGTIVAVGEITERGVEEIDAAGLLVTPGFVDIHTHYDGQVTWENRTLPSAAHGVTTVVMGNCGVGFAPCRRQDREKLIGLMEGVEDIPGVVMAEGLPWNWETFSEYLDAIEQRPHDVDIAAQLPHSCLRVYVMGQRGVDREPATEAELIQMKRLACEAMQAGALGFATSRSVFHRDRNGIPIPTKDAMEAELYAIAAGMQEAGHGVIEALIDFDDIETEFGLLRRVAAQSGRPLSFTVTQILGQSTAWARALDLISEANQAGIAVKGQVIGRPTGMLLGLNLSFNPFSLHPAYREIEHLPLAARVDELRTPARRARILGETPDRGQYKMLDYISRFDRIYPLGDPPDYAPAAESSIASVAARCNLAPEAVAYDALLERDGNAVLFLPIGNYADGNLDPVLAMLKHEHTVLGLGDGGAHYGVICDAGYPTFMMTYWCRDRADGERLPLPSVIKALARDTADAVGLQDRGLVQPGFKADLNLIDYERLSLHAPRVVFDLPAGGRRLVQDADGYVATIVSGVVTYRNGQATGGLPGRLVRGPQTATASSRAPAQETWAVIRQRDTSH